MKSTTVKGTNDYLPAEAELRDYMQSVISATYKNNGFERIMTPALEDMENLDKSEGGENLNLIFKIMKRGEKLSKALEEGNFEDLADIGLRYDLTLPLSRFYANNKDKVILPMKCIQMDKVYRAERPQKGRLREFMQCDIDIIGSTSLNSEIELIVTTSKALLALGMKNFRVKINDRRLLKILFSSIGWEEELFDSFCISLDKIDKIGLEGIEKELLEKEFGEDQVNKFVDLFKQYPFTLDTLRTICKDSEVIESLEKIIAAVKEIAKDAYTIDFDISLVRGQGYYTGTIFEIESKDFKGSIAGGGRYDNLIGKFLNEQVPAVGFSIGFERIFAILRDTGFTIPNQRKVALLYEKEQLLSAYEKAEELRDSYMVSLYEMPKKTGKFLNKLTEAGYYGYYILGRDEEVSVLK